MHKFTVSQVNRFIKQIILSEQMFYGINIEGEILNFKYHSNGHMYFSLKDEKSSISCVLFKEQADSVSFLPCDGMYVVVKGDIGVYEAYGKYQLYGFSIKQCDKEGEFQKQVLELKEKLLKEGLFRLESKRELPKFPGSVGVIAAKGGSAIEDILKIFSRRFPIVRLKIFFSIMQGEKAVNSIMKALKLAKKEKLDALIIARGGGSREDLSVFDNEQLARFVYDFKTPVVSAIGHEDNWSILDLVSDLRASTPSCAVEMICPDVADLLEQIDGYKILLKNNMKYFLDELFFKINILKRDVLLFSPINYINKLCDAIVMLKRKLKYLMNEKYNYYKNLIERYYFTLQILNPEKIFDRGYGLILDENNQKISSLKKGNILNLYFKKVKFKIKILEQIYKK